MKDVLPWRLREPDRGSTRKTCKEVVDRDMDDLQLKLSDAVNRSKWREMIRENWSDSNNNSGAVSWR